MKSKKLEKKKKKILAKPTTTKLKSKNSNKSQPNPQQNPCLTTKLKSKKFIANQPSHQKPQPPPTANPPILEVAPVNSVDLNPYIKAFEPRIA